MLYPGSQDGNRATKGKPEAPYRIPTRPGLLVLQAVLP